MSRRRNPHGPLRPVVVRLYARQAAALKREASVQGKTFSTLMREILATAVAVQSPNDNQRRKTDL
jgi:hypothetical protein